VDWLTVFGLLALGSMMAFYALEGMATAFIVAFAVACVGASIYGFLSGAWPFGVVELLWSTVAFRRWWRARGGRTP